MNHCPELHCSAAGFEWFQCSFFLFKLKTALLLLIVEKYAGVRYLHIPLRGGKTCRINLQELNCMVLHEIVQSRTQKEVQKEVQKDKPVQS
jgi:hypothetical protein